MSWFKKDPLQVIVFQSCGTDTHFHCRGRALEDEIIDLSKQSYWSLFINSWKRFESDEIKYADLEIRLPNNQVIHVTTDNHGYFVVDEPSQGLSAYTDDEGWLHFSVSYIGKELKRTIQQNNEFKGKMLIPSEGASYGIVSDIDDTILHTGVVSNLKWQVVFNTLFKPANKRIELEGASDLYMKFHEGKAQHEANPIFYVSHSPWNLYRYLEFFLNDNEFPAGPILLRSFKTILKRKERGEKPQKQKEILALINTYPNLKFILVGDSGEKDPDIYMEITEQFPDRILAIYLRSVKSRKKINRVNKLIAGFTAVPVLLVENSEDVIIHARKHKLL